MENWQVNVNTGDGDPRHYTLGLGRVERVHISLEARVLLYRGSRVVTLCGQFRVVLASLLEVFHHARVRFDGFHVLGVALGLLVELVIVVQGGDDRIQQDQHADENPNEVSILPLFLCLLLSFRRQGLPTPHS